ncbi:MAG TPA: hypothetical protein VLM11_00440, partial [Streptosporangiaceae bacterium]|nr:hypothetical protein [Streptosporangiaceae bacterium]
EPVTALVWELVQEGYEANCFCYIASHATEHAAELDRTTPQPALSGVLLMRAVEAPAMRRAMVDEYRSPGRIATLFDS